MVASLLAALDAEESGRTAGHPAALWPGERVTFRPAVGHDLERLDEGLPARGEGDAHAEVEDLVVGEVPPQLGVECAVDRAVVVPPNPDMERSSGVSR